MMWFITMFISFFVGGISEYSSHKKDKKMWNEFDERSEVTKQSIKEINKNIYERNLRNVL